MNHPNIECPTYDFVGMCEHTYPGYMEKLRSVFQAERSKKRWKKTSPKDKKAHMEKMTAASLKARGIKKKNGK